MREGPGAACNGHHSLGLSQQKCILPVLEAGSLTFRRQQGSAPSKGSREGSFLPLPTPVLLVSFGSRSSKPVLPWGGRVPQKKGSIGSTGSPSTQLWAQVQSPLFHSCPYSVLFVSSFQKKFPRVHCSSHYRVASSMGLSDGLREDTQYFLFDRWPAGHH